MKNASEKPMRVAQIMGKMAGGGVEAIVLDLYRHIDRRKIQFDFIIDDDSSVVPLTEIELLGGRVYPIAPYQRLMRYRSDLERVLRENNYKIVHSHINALSVFPLQIAKKVGIPVRIAHSHSTMGKRELAKNAMKRALRPFSNRYPTHRLACSSFAGKWLYGNHADFEIVHNAIDLDAFAFDAEVRKRTRAELGLSNDDFVVGHVGRFETQKNHVLLIEAFSALASEMPEARLLLIGSGGLFEKVMTLARSKGIAEKVTALGYVERPSRYYQAFDVFALPSLYEGFGTVAIEAQVAGLPCILSDVVPQEVMIADTVKYLPIDDPLLWADSLAKCSRKAAQRRGSCINDRAAQLYSIDNEAAKLAALYERLVGAIDDRR